MDLPVDANVGRVFRFGKLPINLLIRAHYNVVKPRKAVRTGSCGRR